MVRPLLLSYLGLLIACSNPVSPTGDIESRAVAIEAPAIYLQWWNEIEACSGQRGDFSAVAFYELPGTHEFTVAGKTYWGYWVREGNKIILASDWTANEKWVKHEEMHALLQRSDHPATYFNGVCGNLL